MNAEQMAKLREPFPPETIGKLPKISCPACSKAEARVCDKHTKQRCSECENWITTAHVHLDYVGHAAATDRLLQVDPEWTWEPVAFDASGLPAMANGLFWIRLTVAGVTRYGVGDGPTAKVMIGDAIRNAAMRFGVALDLWAKEDLHAATPSPAPAQTDEPAPVDEPAPEPSPPSERFDYHAQPLATKEDLARIGAALKTIEDPERRKVTADGIASQFGPAHQMRAADVDIALALIAAAASSRPESQGVPAPEAEGEPAEGVNGDGGSESAPTDGSPRPRSRKAKAS